MNNSLYKQLVNSFHKFEKDDFEAVSSIIDRRTKNKDVVIISRNPHLLTLVFTSLIRYFGINIHILNPEEGSPEINRLLYVINPNYAIITHDEMDEDIRFPRMLVIDEDAINQEHGDTVEDPEEIDFTIITYSPTPSKVNRISSEMFLAMVESFVQDLIKFDLIRPNEAGLIPLATTNSDYLLHMVAIKIARDIYNCPSSLPANEGISLIVKEKKWFFSYNSAKTLFIPKKEFIDLWESTIVPLFENRFIFRSYLRRKWLVNLLVRRKLKQLFKGFENVIIIGTINNSYMIDVLKNLSFVKFYSIFTIKSAMLYGPISRSLDSIILSSNEFRQDITIRCSDNMTIANGPIVTLSFRFFHPENRSIYSLTDTRHRFVEGDFVKEQGVSVKQYFPLGDVDNAFNREEAYIFPETLEKVINSYPFIRNCVLLTFNKKMMLIVEPCSNVLDSNRINYKMFNSILHNQIVELNKELPEAYKIQGFVITTSLIEQDRIGEIVRYPFNHCNKMEWL